MTGGRLLPLVLVAWVGIAAAVVAAVAVGSRAAPAASIPAPGGAAGALAVSGTPFTTPLFIPLVLSADDINITMQQSCIELLPGPCTTMWTYGGTYPGPTIRRATGQNANVTFTNNLPVAAGQASIHNHGNHSAPQHDGSPHDYLIPNGDARTYTYEHVEDGGDERGATQWYHDHVMDVTGRNVWNGLSGFYILDDPADPPTLPSGAYDVPLMIADRAFDAGNQIPYVFNTNGVTGSIYLVNGVVEPYIDVADARYRLRILNSSNARVYSITMSNGQAMTQIGTESGLLPAPVARTSMLVSPAERLDVVVDFAGLLGQTLYLRDAISGKDLLQFRVTQDVTDTSAVPAALRPLADLGAPVQTRTFTFGSGGGQWTINGQPFDHTRIDALPVLGTTERWTFVNATGAPHVVHVHDVDQQCVSKNGGACPAYELTKESWLLTGPGASVTVDLKFSDHVGEYIIHCHILEHEDDGMMSLFEVVTPAATETPTPPPATQTPTPTSTATPTETAAPVEDPDGDGIADGDNCPDLWNPDQANTDSAPLLTAGAPNDVTVPYGDTAGDACDPDDDNDRRDDGDEATGAGCGGLPSDPLLRDTDNDRVIDGAECALGSDPASAASRPLSCLAQALPDSDGDRLCDGFELTIGTDELDGDTDDDGVADGIEYRGYGTSPLWHNTDDDACHDGRESASINLDVNVNSGDLGLVASLFNRSDRPVQDTNKDGIINSLDLSFIALQYTGAPCASSD